MPSQAHRCEVEISGYVARVNMTQIFTNPYDKNIEPVYVLGTNQSYSI